MKNAARRRGYAAKRRQWQHTQAKSKNKSVEEPGRVSESERNYTHLLGISALMPGPVQANEEMRIIKYTHLAKATAARQGCVRVRSSVTSISLSSRLQWRQ